MCILEKFLGKSLLSSQLLFDWFYNICYSEFVAEENEALFWKYVDIIVKFNLALSPQSERTMYEAALKAARMTFDDGFDSLRIRMLKFSLSLRTFSPRIEMFDQV